MTPEQMFGELRSLMHAAHEDVPSPLWSLVRRAHEAAPDYVRDVFVPYL